MMWLLLIIPITLYFLPKYKKTRRKRSIEKALPDALFKAASISSITSYEEMIKILSKGKNPLNKAFENAHKKIEAGTPTKKALQEIQEETNSEMLSRATRLLKHGYETGADISLALRETAEDINQTHEIIREQKTNTLIEKYTLLIAGGCLVPLILGTLTALVGQIGFVDIGIGMNNNTRKAIIENATTGNIIYIGEYAILAAFFISLQENKPEKTLLYAGVLLPTSIIIFLLSKNGIVF